MASVISLVGLIVSNGKLKIDYFNYAQHRREEIEKLEVEKPISLKHNSNSLKAKIVQKIIRQPIIGPLLATASYIKYQFNWPTYVFHHKSKNIAYIRISKSGCTSIQSVFLSDQFGSDLVNNMSEYQINMMGLDFIKPQLTEGYECFTVVRDPIDRIISCYNDKVLKTNKEFHYYQDYLFGIIKEDMLFHDFLKTIDRIPDRIKDMHFRPQHCFTKPIKLLKVFRLGRDNDHLNQFLNRFDMSMTHIHKTPFKKITRKDLSLDSVALIKKNI